MRRRYVYTVEILLKWALHVYLNHTLCTKIEKCCLKQVVRWMCIICIVSEWLRKCGKRMFDCYWQQQETCFITVLMTSLCYSNTMEVWYCFTSEKAVCHIDQSFKLSPWIIWILGCSLLSGIPVKIFHWHFNRNAPAPGCNCIVSKAGDRLAAS